jgi:uncharacterized repeat protein (TIGR04052 family)
VSAGQAQIRDLRFYIYDIEWLDADGASHAMHLDGSSAQGEALALVDLRNDKTSALSGRIDRGLYTGVRFTLGVPFQLNHGNPLTAKSPLDRGDLFWAWQSGYKFLRVDAREEGHEWSFHLGSTGCSSASALRPPASPCAQPNRVHVELRNFDPLRQSVVVNLTELIRVMRAATYRVCTGDYSSPDCSAAYALTGLNAVTGTCTEHRCPTQKLFSVSEK